MADYFDRLLKPRILKAVYSPDWRAGKPLSRQGISHCLKVLRLESYEDALNNLDIHRTDAQKNLLDTVEANGIDRLREQYMLRYMLDVETRSNGTNNLENLRATEDTWKVRLIEEDFHRLMFATEGM
jgi:adenine-specific DNA-methyltransferase